MDAPGVPLLLSVKTLTRLGAVIDFSNAAMCLEGIAPGFWIPLKRGQNGHLLLDMTRDWLDPSMCFTNDILVTPLEYKDVADVKPPCQQSEPEEHLKVSQVEVDSEEELIPADESHGSQCVHALSSSSDALHGPMAVLLSLHAPAKPHQLDHAEHDGACPHEHDASGSSMRLGLPLLAVALASAPLSSALSCDKGHVVKPEQFQGQSQVGEKASGVEQRQVRLDEGRACGSQRPMYSGIPMLGQPREDERRPWITERPEWPRSVGSLCQMQTSTPLCASVWRKGQLSKCRTTGCRHSDCDPAGERSRGGGAPTSGAAQHPNGECDWSRGVFEGQAGEIAEREEPHDSSRTPRSSQLRAQSCAQGKARDARDRDCDPRDPQEAGEHCDSGDSGNAGMRGSGVQRMGESHNARPLGRMQHLHAEQKAYLGARRGLHQGRQ